MGNKRRLILVICIASFLQSCNGQCQINGGLQLGPVPNHLFIQDIFRGIITSEATTNINSITHISYGGALLSPDPYLDITLENSQFVVQTNTAFDQYEEHETALSISVTITFGCTGGNTTPLILVINIEDTNNNSPEFIPTNEFEFILAPPLPPGFLITGCLNEITVRDIDLTTSRIIFEIEENPYFEIDYDAVASASAGVKEFKAQLRTLTFIRTLREPIALRIIATDVDATSDPPLSTSGTIRISGDTEFEFPEEPVFSQTLYFATYTDDHQLIQLDTISLQQGFDEYVNFTLDGGEYGNYITAITNGNEVSLVVSAPLPIDVMVDKQIYLIVRADREYTSGDSATIVIHLPEDTPLLFESPLYEGFINDSALQLSPLVLSQGYEGANVSARIVGDYFSSFTAIVHENLVTITMSPPIDDIIGNNSFIIIPVMAWTDQSEATTIVSLGIIKNDNVTPVLDKSIYTGSYDPVHGLTSEQIMFVQGFDETVSFRLNGEYESFFHVNESGLILHLTSSVIPPELFEEQRITLSLDVTKPRTVGANAAIIITLPLARELHFEETVYRGTLHNNDLLLQTLSLSNGFDQNVRFTLSGDYSSYFNVTNEQNQVMITLLAPLPDNVITQNTVILLGITAFGLNAVNATTSVVLDIIKEDSTTPVLSQNIYHGTYHGPTNFEIENIFLTQGFDNEVSFRLDDSAHAQYFNISNTGNSATIRLRSAIPEDVIFSEKALIFNVLADKALTVGSNAAVLIKFPSELTESTVMSFSRNYYTGAYEQNEITLTENIVLDTGYDVGTSFELYGDYVQYFELTSIDNGLQISNNRSNMLPPEVIEASDFIILTIEARRVRSVSVWTTVIIDIVKEEVVTPVFSQAFYRGIYTEENRLQFDEHITLSEGYDETVIFDLLGEQATWFRVNSNNNSVSLVLESPIPETVLDDNNQLLFTIIALKSNEFIGRAVISIDLPNDYIRFPEESYKGYIEDGVPVLEAINIQELNIPSDIIPTLSGDYSEYFQVRNQDGNLNLELRNPLTDEILEENNVIILTLAIQYRNDLISTVIVLEVIRAETEILAFERTYYVGSYNESTGLEFEDEIILTDVSFDTVAFDLNGEDAQWFDLVPGENAVHLILIEPIPTPVLLNNHQLIFEITAERSGSRAAAATIVISLSEPYIERLVLGFDQVTYLGSIENNETTIMPPITLSDGNVPGVELSLHGELSDYFETSLNDAIVTVTLRTPIAEQSIPPNRIILLDIHAHAPEAMPAHAAVVLEYLGLDNNNTVVELIFAQPYYTGSYTDTADADAALTFTTPISLSDGYDADVQFALEGDDSQWFTLAGTGNSQTLSLSRPIPAAVLTDNQQLVFVVEALRHASRTTSATIVISLTAGYTEGLVLGFNQVTYLGTIENNETTIMPPITLSDGNVPGVEFSLHGELSDYFETSLNDAIVTVTLRTPIPEQSIPPNRIILLDIHAHAPEAMPAHAAVVLEYLGLNNTVVELIFAQPYYTGSYTDTADADAALTFLTPISLSDGYDADVQFALEGDDSQWFTLAGTGNSQTLSLSRPIPAAVLTNNQQLVFVVEALRHASRTTSATIVISLTAGYTEGLVLGFNQVTYLGSIENNVTTIMPPITLSDGNVPGVELSLHGELSDYFETSLNDAIVTVTLRTPIPEQSIPPNRIILLDIHAHAPEAMPAHAAVVLEYLGLDNNNTVVELIFAQPYYTGSYTDTADADAALTFTTPISLSDGYDADVQFALEGDDSQWFTLSGTGNSQTLSLSRPIPAAVLTNNQQLVFVVEALRHASRTTSATIVISLTAGYTEGLVLGFNQVTYLGSIENNETTIMPPITLSYGNVPGVELSLHGELSDYFETSLNDAIVTVTLRTPIPEQSIPPNRIILLDIHAHAPEAMPAHAAVVLEYLGLDNNNTVVELIFAQPYYTGSYTDTADADAALTFTTPISLSDGYDADVQFALEGDDSQWFTLSGTGNSQTLSLSRPIPAAVLTNNQQLVFVVEALRHASRTTSATIVISLTAGYTEGLVLGFNQVTYLGSIENNETTIMPPITLSDGNVPGVELSLHGELSDYFETSLNDAIVTVTLRTPIPEQSIPPNRIILLDIHAHAPEAMPAHAAVVLEYLGLDNNNTVVELIFAQPYYTGSYTDTADADAALTFTTPISLSDGYDADVQFALEGDDSQWFTLSGTGNSQTLSLSRPIPAAVLTNNQQLVFVVEALRHASRTTSATIVISLTAGYTDGLVLGFNQVTYLGSIENNETTIMPPITLSDGNVPGVELSLHGELSDYFETSLNDAIVTVTLRTSIPEQSIPPNRIILLDIHAHAPEAMPAHAAVVLEYLGLDNNNTVVELIFAQPYYTGSYTDIADADAALTFTTPISLSDGYDADVQFALEGDDSQWFTLTGTGNSQILSLSSPIPAEVLTNNQQLVFVVEALRLPSRTTSATIVISLITDSQFVPDVSFEKVVFEGIMQNNIVRHETITITGFNGSHVELNGVYASSFEADLVEGEVTVRTTEALSLPASMRHLILELWAETARAVLVLEVSQSEVSTPIVTFSSASYAVRVEITDTGLVGQVQASADNGEALRYTLQLNNVHLQERLSINDVGELHLSAPVNSGLYTFQVLATTIFTQETGTATVHLSAEAVTVCGNDIVMPPLIVLDRDEEEPHYNLINTYEGCNFSLTNRWPLNQTWLYVNETGLHTTSIDREHGSIAFMTQSQVQVEITLQCDTDETRVKRSLNSKSPDPYDYGASKWILADTILYNSRRSLINLIVNDINDNAPIFVGKEQEPIAVGYPVSELEERVLPRSLAELQATDADIGENAALLYWSSESTLAVAPSTGFVHVRDGARLENGAQLTVHATDQNGQGLTGSIDIVVRLLDQSNILVVTVRDAFLDNETNVLARLSESVGYEIKVLRSVVMPDESNEETTRKKRQTTNTGASLQLFIYGLINREPVSIERLIDDITNTVVAQVNIASTVSLEDHLAGQEICVIPGRDTGLLAATIVLSVLLFIVTVLIAIWFFLRWRRKQNYDQFSDANSLASRNESLDLGPKPEEVLTKPRLNIEELKKSERRLQEMLDAPSQVTAKPAKSKKVSIDVPSQLDPNAAIVIQSIDKLKDAADESSDDEFGERKVPRRKSVVTFNENVEKIIHVEDDDTPDMSPGFEIYKL